ncbi:acyl-CoA thioesterase [Streptomyces sp. NPDC088847]|uniref:acyl-CoA thioesterase n=1 Tax=Streptomyces sp. NPDC088847 TaxID=3365909 RepID=UPI0037FBEE54
MHTAGTDTQPSSDRGGLVPVSVHFDDLDPMGRLHNSRYQVLVERAWIGFWLARGFGEKSGFGGDLFHVVKAFTITYDAPVTNLSEYAVHLWVDHLGNTSATARYRVCSTDGHTTYARGNLTVVRIDNNALQPTPWSDSFREVAQSLQAPRDVD